MRFACRFTWSGPCGKIAWTGAATSNQMKMTTLRPRKVESVTRRHFGAAAWSATFLWLVVAGCGDEARQRFQIVGLATGVDRVEVKVVGATSDCSAAAVADVTVTVSKGVAVATVNLAPGDYRLCVTPVDVTGAP